MPVMRTVTMIALAGIGARGAVGGWAVITVENPPEYLVSGTTYQLKYVVRQHGVTLLTGLDGSVQVEPGEAGAGLSARAEAGPSAGHYAASLQVPNAPWVTLIIRSGFGGGGWGDLTTMSIPVIRSRDAPPVLSAAERGRRLFVAKGCGTCHVNGDVPDFARANKVLGVGPELTARRLEASYVRQRLTNPASLPRIGDGPVRMPDLALAPAEVEALVALVSGSTDRAGP